MKKLTSLKRTLACAVSVLPIVAHAEEQTVTTFAIDEQPLSKALVDFSEQAGITIVASSRLTDGKTANAIQGEFNPATALDALLNGSDLVAQADEGVIVLAQAEPPITVEPPASQPAEEVESDEIVVKGFRSAFRNSLEAKRNANQVIDTINAEEIGQFPDQNIAESIQRITGVQITRNNGEGESVNIRGLSSTFTRVEVDGRSTSVTIDSANPERASVLSVFTSDLYSNIEVVKSPTAADVEGGVGGIVRLNTPNPLDIGKLSWGVDGGIIYGEQRDLVEPTFSGFYTNVFADGRLGVLLSGTFDRRDRAIDKIQSNQNWLEIETGDLDDDTDPDQLALVGGRYPGRLRQERKEGRAPKYNINAKVQYEVSDALELFVNGVYTLENREEQRSRIQAQFSRGDLQGGLLDPETNTLLEAQFDRHRVEFAQFLRDTDIETIGLTGGATYETEDWLIDLEGSYQSSEEDFTESRVQHRTNRDGDGGYSIVNNPEYPEFFTEATTLDFADIDLRELSQQQRVISLEEYDVELDIKRFVDWGPVKSVQIGGRFATAEFDRRQGLIASPATGSLTYADGVPIFQDTEYAVDFGSLDLLRQWPAIDPFELYNRFPSTDEFVFDDENLWTIEEQSYAAYVMANYEADLGGLFARGNVGVRLVQTDYSGQGRVNIQSSDLTAEFDPDGNQEVFLDDEPTIDRGYFEPLPSFNLVLAPGEESELQVRLAVSRALSRPTINEINPGVEVNTDDGDIVRGNPELDPFTAWQYDAGIEYYFGDESAVSVAFFYKDVSNFIVADAFEETVAFSQVGLPEQTFTVETFRNGGDAKIQGVEAGLQAPLDFLPGVLSNLGIVANYTFTDSEFTNEAGFTQTFPGASRHAFNLVGYYEAGGFSSRIAYNYRDDFLIEPAQTDGNTQNAEFGDSQGRLDFAMRYRFENGIRVSLDLINITEEQNYKYYDTPQRLEDLEFEGRVYTFRLGYIF